MPDQTEKTRESTPPDSTASEPPEPARRLRRQDEPPHLPPGSMGDWATI